MTSTTTTQPGSSAEQMIERCRQVTQRARPDLPIVTHQLCRGTSIVRFTGKPESCGCSSGRHRCHGCVDAVHALALRQVRAGASDDAALAVARHGRCARHRGTPCDGEEVVA